MKCGFIWLVKALASNSRSRLLYATFSFFRSNSLRITSAAAIAIIAVTISTPFQITQNWVTGSSHISKHLPETGTLKLNAEKVRIGTVLALNSHLPIPFTAVFQKWVCSRKDPWDCSVRGDTTFQILRQRRNVSKLYF